MQPFFHEAKVEVGEDTLHLVLNFRAIDVIESITGEIHRASIDFKLTYVSA